MITSQNIALARNSFAEHDGEIVPAYVGSGNEPIFNSRNETVAHELLPSQQVAPQVKKVGGNAVMAAQMDFVNPPEETKDGRPVIYHGTPKPIETLITKSAQQSAHAGAERARQALAQSQPWRAQ